MSKLDLKKHIEKLREIERNKPAASSKDAILFWGTSADKSYLPHLKGCVGSTLVYLRQEKITTLTQVQTYCKAKKVNRVVTTSIPLLSKLLHWDKKGSPSLANYEGSYFTIPSLISEDEVIEIVFIRPLEQLVTVTFGKFMVTRIITKLTKPESWFKPTEFTGFTVLNVTNYKKFLAQFEEAFLISIDIETLKENTVIRCLSYTAFFYDSTAPSGMKSISVELSMEDSSAVSIMKQFNNLPAPKVMQNGKYDIAYMTRYNAPVYNYLYDTSFLFHAWYSELPKNLGFLNSFFIREAQYWKDLSETNDEYEYFKYNCLDTWGTGNAFLAMLTEAPDFAFNNYSLSFPLTFPCHLAEMTGIARDMEELEKAKQEVDGIRKEHQASLDKILGIPEGESFNVNSPPQMKALLKLLGCGDFKSADAKHLEKVRFRHPFNARIVNHVKKIRETRKLISTYITAGKEFKRFDGTGNRILYCLNPTGTDSSRLASKEHHFWCGLQIQNIPRTGVTKKTFVADPGFYIAEVDLEQAESRDTAYISGDEALINNVEYSPDFHCANASAFFGIAFDELYDVVNKVKLNIPIRNLAKNVNHGANYNMGELTLIDTMGEENISRARALLGLPRTWSYKEVAAYLLDSFHRTYPSIRKVFYAGVIEEITTTHKLESLAVHYSEDIDKYDEVLASVPRWTRHCFGDPRKSKPALNSYISHPPQSLNAQTLNKAWLKVFYEVAMHPEYGKHFKLCAQIHDSILFQWREGHEYLCDLVKEAMEIPIVIRGYDKIVRKFIVPAGIKNGVDAANGNYSKYWSDTE